MPKFIWSIFFITELTLRSWANCKIYNRKLAFFLRILFCIVCRCFIIVFHLKFFVFLRFCQTFKCKELFFISSLLTQNTQNCVKKESREFKTWMVIALSIVISRFSISDFISQIFIINSWIFLQSLYQILCSFSRVFHLES